MKTTGWSKIKGAPAWLEVREGSRKTSYRVRFRQTFQGRRIEIEQTLEGEFSKWQKAAEEGEKLIYAEKFGQKPEERALTTCEDLVDRLLAEAESQDKATIEIKTNIFKLHLLPWLDANGYCRAKDLTVETWPKYRDHKRKINPTIALENHVKYFRMLRKRAYELGLIKMPFPVKFDLKKEEPRKEGQVMTELEEKAILECTNRTWRERSILQRDTGMRPGEVRRLHKGRVKFLEKGGQRIAVVSLTESDTKTHRARSFEVHSTRAVEILYGRWNDPSSPYFFPMETDKNRPMDKHLNGWKAALRRADEKLKADKLGSVRQDLTPHDWRHTYADEMFKKTGPTQWASLCYQIDMSLETAQKTYIHFTTKDTTGVAELVARERRAA